MFGHQNDVISQDQRADASVPLPEETINALTVAPPTDSQTDNHDPVTTAPPPSDPPTTDIQPTVVSPTPPQPPSQSLDGFIPSQTSYPAASSGFSSPVAPPKPFGATDMSQMPQAPEDFAPTDQPEATNAAPEFSTPSENLQPTTTYAEPPSEPDMSTVPLESPAQHVKVTPHPDELLKIKQDALTSLSPLVGKLDVPPEEKFRTVMMLIQASDDPAHLGEAYELAQTITDEKVRAQALLDIVNEINYFTQKDKSA